MASAASNADPEEDQKVHDFLWKNFREQTHTVETAKEVYQQHKDMCEASASSVHTSTQTNQAGEVLRRSIVSYGRKQPKEVKLWMLRTFECGSWLSVDNVGGGRCVPLIITLDCTMQLSWTHLHLHAHACARHGACARLRAAGGMA